MMNFGSLFTGIGGFDAGFERAGMRAAWQCEVEPSCRRVLKKHFPGVDIFDDVTTINTDKLVRVDVLCGGFPCQDLSVAGRREGLAGKRSGLWTEFHRIIKGIQPQWVVIENVPGLLSSNEGRDFAAILRGLVECGYGVAYRILDAQYFGVAQRRRRVFIVGSLGNGSSAEILFERESLPWNPAASRKAGARVASPITRSFASHHGRTVGNNGGVFNMITHPLTARHDSSEDGCGRGVPLTVEGFDKGRAVHTGDIAAPLRVNGAMSEGVNDGKPDNQCVMLAYAVRPSAERTLWDGSDNLVAWHENKQGELSPSEIAKSLRAGASHSYQGVGVRRLTPTECERLQGFDDGWTVGESDSARYRMLGNAVAVPVAEWIGRRIKNYGRQQISESF